MALETFTWQPRAGAVGEVAQRLRKTQFGDGYAQHIGDGLNDLSQTWPLTFTAKRAQIEAIRDFLARHKGARAFAWTPPLGELGLYCYTQPYTIAPLGAGVYSIAVVFEQAFHP